MASSTVGLPHREEGRSNYVKKTVSNSIQKKKSGPPKDVKEYGNKPADRMKNSNFQQAVNELGIKDYKGSAKHNRQLAEYFRKKKVESIKSDQQNRMVSKSNLPSPMYNQPTSSTPYKSTSGGKGSYDK